MPHCQVRDTRVKRLVVNISGSGTLSIVCSRFEAQNVTSARCRSKEKRVETKGGGDAEIGQGHKRWGFSLIGPESLATLRRSSRFHVKRLSFRSGQEMTEVILLLLLICPLVPEAMGAACRMHGALQPSSTNYS